MIIGERLRAIRESKNLSQGDIEKRTGLLRFYISRVENGHTVPSLETLEKFARALDLPTYKLFIGAYEKPDAAIRGLEGTVKGTSFGNKPKERRYLVRFWRLLERMSQSNRSLLLFTAKAMAKRKRRV